MDAFIIRGGNRLRGRLRVNGSKNAALPLMAAALLTDEPVLLRDVPDLSDIRNMARLLATLGCPVTMPIDGEADQTLHLHANDPSCCEAHYDIVRKMRASICALGPLVAKRGFARVSMPGGCNIGARPVDLHLRGLRALGAKIHLDEGYIVAEAPGYDGPGEPGRLRGSRVFLGGTFGSTVLGTANVMSAAVLAEGVTIIESAACEPEVVDLANMLIAMGACIEGAGSPRMIIEGVEQLRGVDHTVMPDRIEAGTYVMAAAITNGDVIIENFPGDALMAALDQLEQVGVYVEPVEEDEPVLTGATSRRGGALTGAGGSIRPNADIHGGGYGGASGGGGGRPLSRTIADARQRIAASAGGVAVAPARTRTHALASQAVGDRQRMLGGRLAGLAAEQTVGSAMRQTVRVASSRRLRPAQITTQPHPGFPTDLQAQMMALLCLADGNSIITEKIFPDRFLHVAELERMGANLTRIGPSVLVSGTHGLVGAPVMASDLRASAGLILAGLAATGTTTVNRVYHLDRGYERMELTLQALGADIKRVNGPNV